MNILPNNHIELSVNNSKQLNLQILPKNIIDIYPISGGTNFWMLKTTPNNTNTLEPQYPLYIISQIDAYQILNYINATTPNRYSP